MEIKAKIEPSNVIKYFLKQGANQIARDWGDNVALLESRFFEKGDLLVVKLPGFALDPDAVDHVIGKMRAHKGVVLDLRGILAVSWIRWTDSWMAYFSRR